MVSDDWVTGTHGRVPFPAHPDALRRGGAPFLTEAFRASGALSPDGSVTRVLRCDDVGGGSTGRKVALDVEYDKLGSDLRRELFVKFSRDFDDPRRDGARTQMEAEVQFACLSSAPGFPIVVPKVQFADYDGDTGTGILITERIPFGCNGIEAHHPKCLDRDMPDAIDHYRALLTALGRLAGTARSGVLSQDLVDRFPVDLRAATVGEPPALTAEKLCRRIARLSDFADSYPGLLPENVRSPQFLAQLNRQAHDVMHAEPAIWHHLAAAGDHIALCHWNANVDNAWFWRAADGDLECGLMDWGCVSQMNIAMAVWGCLSGAETDMWDQHLDGLLQLLCREFQASGGPLLDTAELEEHLQLYVALMGITWLLDVPAVIRRELPDGGPDITPNDPRIRGRESLRAPLLMLTNVLNLWQTKRLDEALEAI